MKCVKCGGFAINDVEYGPGGKVLIIRCIHCGRRVYDKPGISSKSGSGYGAKVMGVMK